eukprot:m.118717 g.118717  ORF g.118717 m.118717 type:complete len:415 (+) comp28690_c0_seq1:52-1296(+)
MSRTDPQTLPGPCDKADIRRKKAQLLTSLQALHIPFSSSDSVDKDLLAVEQLEKHFFQWSNELCIYREAGGVFKCSFKATQPVESDSVTVTRQGRIILAQAGVVSVVLPDELNSIYSAPSSGRWGRTAPKISTSFVLHWSRQRPNHAPESIKTLVFFDNEGKEFEAVIRALIATRRQAAWRQAQQLSARVTQLEDTFDIGMSSHRAGVVKFWNCCYPNERIPQPRARNWSSEAAHTFWKTTWEEVGFTNGNLDAAFEGIGTLGLKQLLFFAEQNPDLLTHVMGDTRQRRSPTVDIGIIGCAITKLLVHMQFETGSITAPLPVETTNSFTKQSSLSRLLLQCRSNCALEMVYCLALETALEVLQLTYNNDMSNLPDVIEDVESSLNACLTKLPMSLQELTIMMKLEHARKFEAHP